VPTDPKPAAEVAVDEALVRRLLADQHPDLADRSLVELAAGWDNVLFRLGDDLLVRLPRRQLSAALVEHEQRWLPELAPRLPVPVSDPVRVGRPALGYPWAWSVCRWIDGATAAAGPLDADGVARDLGAFLRALHAPAPSDAPVNPYRGVPLADRSEVTHERTARLADVLDAPAVLACWDELVAVPRWAGPPLWVHGDLHPGNLIVRHGRLAGVVDFGDLTAGDPAVDLSVAWRLLPPEARPVLRAAAGEVAEETWARARGWALCLSVATLTGSSGNEQLTAESLRGVAAVLAD
jgi:aminoglycoside phosphotransferase (APT) family kinase protein